MMPEKEKGCSWSRIFFVFFRFFSMKNHNELCVIGLFRDIFSGAKVSISDATWLQKNGCFRFVINYRLFSKGSFIAKYTNRTKLTMP